MKLSTYLSALRECDQTPRFSIAHDKRGIIYKDRTRLADKLERRIVEMFEKREDPPLTGKTPEELMEELCGISDLLRGGTR